MMMRLALTGSMAISGFVSISLDAISSLTGVVMQSQECDLENNRQTLPQAFLVVGLSLYINIVFNN